MKTRFYNNIYIIIMRTEKCIFLTLFNYEKMNFRHKITILYMVDVIKKNID